MKLLTFSGICCGYGPVGVNLLLEEAECFFHDGHSVTFAYCDGIMDVCPLNQQGSATLCRYCRHCMKSVLQQLSPEIRLLPLKKRQDAPTHIFEYNSVSDIKSLFYKGVEIGSAALSSYISSTRNCDPDFTPEFRRYFDHLLDQTAHLTDEAEKIIEHEKPDVIAIANGRTANNRPFFDLALKHKIALRSNETVGTEVFRSERKRIVYENCLPHDIAYNTKMMEQLWNMPEVPEAEKEKIAADFFIRRRNAQIACDRVYTKYQIQGAMPEGFDPSLKNIVIFNSSEDEYASLGREFDQYCLWENQRQALTYIFDHIRESEYHFYLRIHPNLRGIPYRWHQDLYQFEKHFPNVTVIPPEDKISSYALLDAAEKVLVFGSTMGPEAVYWGKPVILGAGALYRALDICYTPKTQEEMWELIRKTLAPKEHLGALKYAYFIPRRDLLTLNERYFPIHESRKSFCGRSYLCHENFKLFGSTFLLKAAYHFMDRHIVPFDRKFHVENVKVFS